MVNTDDITSELLGIKKMGSLRLLYNRYKYHKTKCYDYGMEEVPNSRDKYPREARRMWILQDQRIWYDR